MAFGILETDLGHGNPTGTILLEELEPESHHTNAILIPRPSKSNRDPLNMSKVRKELYFTALTYGSCVTGVVGPLLVPGFSIVAAAFNIGLSQVTLLNGSLIIMLGVSSYICAPLATIFGRRIVYLVMTLLMVFGCVWASYAQTYGSLLGARLLQGLGMGAFFSLAGTVSINDVFFVHERGRRAGLWNFSIIVSVNIAPVISSYLITGLSWQWSFSILAIAFAVAFVLVLCLMPETRFDRQSIEGAEISGSVPPRSANQHVGNSSKPEVSKSTPHAGLASSDGSATSIPSRTPWTKSFGIQEVQYEGITQLLSSLVSPLTLLRYPIIIWACAMWSVTFSWVIIQGAVADQIYEAPPFDLSPTGVGILIGVPPLIGSALGTLIGGWSCDLAAKVMAVRNSGIYEPEFRLVVMIPSLITTGIGSYGLGLAIADGLSIWASAIFFGFLNFGVGMGCTGIIAYTNDVCQQRSAEAFGIAMLVKSAFAFGLTFILNDYYVAHGAKLFFLTWAGLTTGVTIFTIPLYVYGKRLRASMKI